MPITTKIQILVDYSNDSNGYSMIASPEWVDYSEENATSIFDRMTSLLDARYSDASQTYVLCRLVEVDDPFEEAGPLPSGWTRDLVTGAPAYDRYFFVDVSELSTGISIPEEEETIVEAAYDPETAYKYAKNAYEDMWAFVIEKADMDRGVETGEQWLAIQTDLWKGVFAPGGYLSQIEGLLYQAGVIGSGVHPDGSSFDTNYGTGESPDDWHDKESDIHKESYYYTTSFMHDKDWTWTTSGGEGVQFLSSWSMTSAKRAAGHLDLGDYDGVSSDDYATTCVLGNLILKHFDHSGARWRDYKPLDLGGSADAQGFILIHFGVCGLSSFDPGT